MDQVEELNRDFIRARTAEEQVHETSPSAPEEAAALDREACEYLAKTYSSRGEHRRAIEWGLRALQHSKRDGLPGQAGKAALLIAQQCRHQGRFDEALRYYAQAEQSIRDSGAQGFEARTDLLRISAGRIMTENFLVLGDSNAALHAYEAIDRELEDLRASNSDRSASDWLQLYELHLRRQQAELYRQVGLYSDSFQLFDELYHNYSYIEVAPKAWSLLGKAEAARMLGRTEEALESYKGAENFASNAPDLRLLARVLRNRAELARSQGRDPVPILEEFEKVVKKNDYLYGRIYFLLIRGGHELDVEAYSSAISSFHEARTLCRADGRPIGTEAVHAVLGLAEAYRLSGQLSEAESLLRQARDGYSRKGIAWGYLRATLALTSISDSSETRMPESEERADASFLQFVTQPQRVSSRTVFVNLL
jgi:tetratricopeptide (TPR) repeat protein